MSSDAAADAVPSLDSSVLDGPTPDLTDSGSDARGHDASSERPVGRDCEVGVVKPSAACAPRDEAGIFVSRMGSDDAIGTRERPVLTIAKALAMAKEAGRGNVYVCASAGPYAAPILIGAPFDGFALYGGLDCDSWLWRPDATTEVRPAPGSVPLTVEGIASAFTIEDFSLVAADETTPGQSSVAAFVSTSAGIHFTRVKLEAGAGMRGSDGKDVSQPSNYLDIQPTDPRICGYTAAETATQQCIGICADNVHGTGGKGASGRTASGAGSLEAEDGTPAYSQPGGRGGLLGTNEAPSTPGERGADAPAGHGGEGATRAGTLTSKGWLPEAGSTGKNGSPGQGGGGGGAAARGGKGGGGACGGCGGAGGPGGRGGGSSFALLSYKSSILLEGCTLTAASGGDGGMGGQGQLGQAGGKGGSGSDGNSSGGDGGKGGAGGPGGGGAGGLVAAVAFVGTAPQFSTNDTRLHVKDRAGSGGEPGIARPPEVVEPVDAAIDGGAPDATIADAASEPAELGDAEISDADAASDVIDDGSVADGATQLPIDAAANEVTQPATRGIDGIAQPVLDLEGS